MAKTSERLRHEHEQLEALLRRLGDDATAADPAVLQSTWREFERRLLSHFDWEERRALPLVDAQHPSEARALLAEHDRIRSLVARLGVDVDIHLVSGETIDLLIRDLAEHTRREDDSLYRWLDEMPAAPSDGGLLKTWRRVSRGIRRLISSSAP